MVKTSAQKDLRHQADGLAILRRADIVFDVDSSDDINAIAVDAARISPAFRLPVQPLQWSADEAASRIHPLAAAIRSRWPAAPVIFRFDCNPPTAWLAAHPEEASKGSPSGSLASWASRRWIQSCTAALRRTLPAMELASSASGTCAIQLAAGRDGAWVSDSTDRSSDQRTLESFRSFLLSKYRRNPGLLKAAWFDVRVTFDTATIPSAAILRTGALGVLRSPTRSRHALDYYECLSEIRGDAAVGLCKAARGIVPGATVGIAIPDLVSRPAAEDGFAYPNAIFESPAIDWFVVNAASGAAPAAPFPLHGKLVLRTAHSPSSVLGESVGKGTNGSLPLARPSAAAPVLEAIRPAAVQPPRGARNAIGVIWDPAGALGVAHAPEDQNILERLAASQLEELSRTGATFDLWMLSDIFRPGFPGYKVVVMLNSVYLSEAERRRIDAQFKRSETTLITLWAAGLTGEHGAGAELAERLTGQKTRAMGAGENLQTRIIQASGSTQWVAASGLQFGLNECLSPTLTIPDKASERIGANGANKTNAAIRKFREWTSVTIQAGPVPARVLRTLLQAAGCPFVCEVQSGSVTVSGSPAAAVITALQKSALKLHDPFVPASSLTDRRARPDHGIALEAGETLLVRARKTESPD